MAYGERPVHITLVILCSQRVGFALVDYESTLTTIVTAVNVYTLCREC